MTGIGEWGSGTDRIIVTDEAGATRVEQNKNPGSSTTFVRMVSSETITLPLTNKRKYVIFFDNSFSSVSAKVVTVRASMHYKAN